MAAIVIASKCRIAKAALGNQAGRGKTMFTKTEKTIFAIAGANLLFIGMAFIDAGSLFLGGLMLFTGAYSSLLTALPGVNR